MQALWDLKTCPPTFDFACFLVCAATLGAKSVHFRYEGEIQTKKFGEEIAWGRFQNITLPLCDLMGMDHTIGPGGEGITPGYHGGTVEAVYRKMGKLCKFPLIDGPKGYVTVTLRESFRNEHRNSSPAWGPFIEALKQRTRVVVLPECELNPIPLETRMRLYSNADMNFGVNNGPMILCMLSEAPYRIFKMIANEEAREHHRKTGMPEGMQFGFKNDRQLIVYDDDTLDVLMEHLHDR